MNKDKLLTLNDVCEVIVDGTHQTPKYEEEGITFLSSRNVTSRKIDWNNTKFISEELHKKLSKRISPRLNDILLAKNGTTGVAAIVDRNCIFDIYVSLALLRPKDIINPKYLLKIINSNSVKRQFNSSLKGIGVPNLHLKEIKKVKIPLPPLEIQRKIADTLDKAQGLIDKRKEQIKKLDEFIQSVFLDMFGFLNENSKNFNIKKFGELILLLTDYHANGSYKILKENVELLDVKNYALMIRTTDLENKEYYKNVKYITREAYDFLKKTKVYGGEIIINKIGSAGKVYLMPDLGIPVSLGMNAFMIRLNKNVNNLYIYYLLNSNYGFSIIQNHVQGAVTKTITKDAIKSLKIPVPPIELQNKFASIVEKTEKQKKLMQKSLTEMENNFNSIMQRAFKGELFN